MRYNFLILMALFFQGVEVQAQWKILKSEGYTIFYSANDAMYLDTYKSFFQKARKEVQHQFGREFLSEFEIYIHPDRESLDSTWQHDWGMPDFYSQCWMVASGVASRLDIISPVRWDSLACEHHFTDTVETQNLITHEMVHVFHGQHNLSSDFSDISGLDWFVEGIATFISGQLDDKRKKEVLEAVRNSDFPDYLEDFWTGNLRYGLSGSVVDYMVSKYNHEILIDCLKFNKKVTLLKALSISENELLEGWKQFVFDTYSK